MVVVSSYLGSDVSMSLCIFCVDVRRVIDV